MSMLERVRRRGVVATMPGVLRIGAETAMHTTVWGVSMYAKGVTRVARAALDPDSAAQLADDLGTAAGALLEVTRALAGTGAVGRAIGSYGVPLLERAKESLEQAGTGGVTEAEALRAAGSELLRRSRDVWDQDNRHPAYANILKELAPDEARILVLLLRDGPQPSVDVIGPRGRQIARGLTMLGSRSSVKYPEAVPQYLNNLTRLGLIWQSAEPLADLLRYQVVEAQPDVLEAKHSVRKSKVQRKSIHLTPFGTDFVQLCFVSDDEDGEVDFPAHEAPPVAATERPADA